MWDKVNQRIQQALVAVRQAFRVVTGTVDSSTKVQLLQLNGLAGEQLDGAEYFQHYGLTTSPPPGSMGIAVPLNGNTSHTVVVHHRARRISPDGTETRRGGPVYRRRRENCAEARADY